MAKNNNSRIFNCESAREDRIELGVFDSGNILEFNWRGSRSEDILLGRDGCRRLVRQVQHFIDTGVLLPDEPPEPTSNDKATARALLAAIGFEVDLNVMRVIQEAKDGDDENES